MFNRGKKKEKTMKEVVFSIKKTTTFGGDACYYPLHKDNDVFGSWNTIFKVNNRTLVSVPAVTNDPTYACITLEEAQQYINEYREELRNKISGEIKTEEFIEYDNINKEQNENEN